MGITNVPTWEAKVKLWDITDCNFDDDYPELEDIEDGLVGSTAYIQHLNTIAPEYGTFSRYAEACLFALPLARIFNIVHLVFRMLGALFTLDVLKVLGSLFLLTQEVVLLSISPIEGIWQAYQVGVNYPKQV